MEIYLKAFAIFFATMGPFDNLAPFAAMTKDYSPAERRKTAIRATLVAASIIVVFGVAGDDLLNFFGIHMPAFKIAGGILLLIASIEMVTGSSEDEGDHKNGARKDIAIFPLAIPLIAAPDALVAVVLQVERAKGDFVTELGILGVALLVNLMVLAGLLSTGYIIRLLGKQGIEVLSRVVGVLLTALAIEFILEGLAEANLFKVIVG